MSAARPPEGARAAVRSTQATESDARSTTPETPVAVAKS